MNLRLLETIKNAPTVRADYRYDDETGNINPAYQDSEHFTCLPPNEKRIWVLRSDMTLSTGIKQIFVEEGNTDLRSKLIGDNKTIDQIAKSDRFGHISLAIPENNYDGKAYTAGWVAQRSNHLEIFLASGRFHNDYLTAFQRQCIEIYIAKKFMDAHGKQDVVFYDFDKDQPGLANFLKDKSLEQTHTKRVYTSDFIDGIDKLKEISPDSLLLLKRSTLKKESSTSKISRVVPIMIEESKSASATLQKPQPLSPKIEVKKSQRSNSIIDTVASFFKRSPAPIQPRRILVEPRKPSILQQ